MTMMTTFTKLDPVLLSEIRRIAAELDTFPFVEHTWNDLSHEHGWHGNAGGGHYEVVPGSGGAAVYHDIIDHGGLGSRAFVQRIADAVILGELIASQPTADAIVEVASLRLAKSYRVARPELPPDAGHYYTPVSREPVPHFTESPDAPVWVYRWPGVQDTVRARNEQAARAAIRAKHQLKWVPNRAEVSRQQEVA